MVTVYNIPCFDLKQIAESGQCFRMRPLGAGEMPEGTESGYRVVSGGKVLVVWQKGEEVSFDCADGDMGFWLDYFDVEADYQGMIDLVSKEDSYLLAASKAGKGIRILRQDPWEMIITFVISQQKTIPKIRELVESLCRRYGTPVEVGNETCQDGRTGAQTECDSAQDEGTVWAFPGPEALGSASLEELQDLKLGYRAKYIHRLCRDATAGDLDLERLKRMDYEEAMDYLTGFYGIGKKVANCVCLFGLHHISAFPVDTWIEKILMEQYYDEQKYRCTPRTCLCDTIVKDCFGTYSGCAGVMQQYIFYYERLRNSKLS